MQPALLTPARLPLGTRVGPWRVLERLGLGAYGAVYRAIGAQAPHGPVALKLALHSGDERFAREVELLSRLRHPSVPHLVDQGLWQPRAGPGFPYLAMELIDGLSLYDWALDYAPSSRQVLRVLSHLASALAATHAVGGVHRDFKGDNVLVRDGDDQVFLVDFGSGYYVGAATLTSPPFPPGTPAYRSPEAWCSLQRSGPDSAVPYAPGPADDVFALGVTAYRLVTGEYPPSPAWMDERALPRFVDGPAPRSPRALNGRCGVELSALVSRMLSVAPETRGSARELAEALDRAVREAGPEADVPLFGVEGNQPSGARTVSRLAPLRSRGGGNNRWRIPAGAAVALLVGTGWMMRSRNEAELVPTSGSVRLDAKDGGTVAIGDTALTAPVATAVAPSVWSTIALEMPPKPFPGQLRPDSSGHCPRKGQVSIQGGCWLKLALAPEDCDETGYVYRNECYVPVFPPARPSTSGPAD